MDYRIASARPMGRALAAGVAAIALSLFVVSAASAQNPPAPKPAAKPAAKPAPKPAEPPAQQPAPQQQELPQLMYSPWTKICQKSQETGGKQICIIAKDGRLENGMPIIVGAMIEPEGAQRFIRVTVPFGVHLPEGTRLIVDQNPPQQAPYIACHPQIGGCIAHYLVDNDLLAKMKKGQNLIVQAVNETGTVMSLPLPLADFAKAYDGPPTDPKALEEQQRLLQEGLRKKAEEAAKQAEGKPPQGAPAPAGAPPK